VTVLVWVAFVCLVLVILAFDLGVFSRESKTITAKQALFRTGVYFTLAMLFTVFVGFAYEYHWFDLGIPPEEATAAVDPGKIEVPHHESAGDDHDAVHYPTNGYEAAAQFFMGYILEQSLSIDNIFVIALILSYFQVPAAYQHRVLLWGILGALVMRGVMIAVGAAVIHRFDWVIYVFGAMLIFTAFKMLFAGDEELDFDQSRLIRMVRRIVPISPGFDGNNFFTPQTLAPEMRPRPLFPAIYRRITGREFGYAATPLFLSLVIVESTDLLFAIDSIPAVFGITQDGFIVFTSNVFAILGLRSLYFALADLLDKFRFLKYSLVAVLAFVGLKMLLHGVLPHGPETTLVSLGVIALTLGAGVGASFIFPAPPEEEHEGHPT